MKPGFGTSISACARDTGSVVRAGAAGAFRTREAVRAVVVFAFVAALVRDLEVVVVERLLVDRDRDVERERVEPPLESL
jgi:hypothetical protein